MFKQIEVTIDDLLLDPNNPRFVQDASERAYFSDREVVSKKVQKVTLGAFTFSKRKRGRDEDEDGTYVKDLYDSMRTIGFVPIDRVVVRRLGTSGKFLVVEGNRRISTVKTLLTQYAGETNVKLSPDERRELAAHLPSFEMIKCMLLETEGLSEDEVRQKVSVVLGLRHHGSLLPWEPLPKAFNIYSEYMMMEPRTETFIVNGQKIMALKDRVSISDAKIRESLRTYVPYLQLKDSATGVEDDHYSLIQSGVTNKHLNRGAYLIVDGATYQLDEPSLALMDKVCQFSIRDSISPGGETKKIIPRPQDFSQLGKLVERCQNSDHEAVRNYAESLIRRVEDEDDLPMTVENAVDELTAFQNRKQWIDTINALLDKCEHELSIDAYTGTGNERGQKDALKQALELLRRLLNV